MKIVIDKYNKKKIIYIFMIIVYKKKSISDFLIFSIIFSIIFIIICVTLLFIFILYRLIVSNLKKNWNFKQF